VLYVLRCVAVCCSVLHVWQTCIAPAELVRLISPGTISQTSHVYHLFVLSTLSKYKSLLTLLCEISRVDFPFKSQHCSQLGIVHFLLTMSHCNTLQHPATHCTTLHHAASHCNTLQHTAIDFVWTWVESGLSSICSIILFSELRSEFCFERVYHAQKKKSPKRPTEETYKSDLQKWPKRLQYLSKATCFAVLSMSTMQKFSEDSLILNILCEMSIEMNVENVC